jgi:hypothetical protein
MYAPAGVADINSDVGATRVPHGTIEGRDRPTVGRPRTLADHFWSDADVDRETVEILTAF